MEAVWSFPPRRKTRDNSDAQFASQAFDKSRRLADPAPQYSLRVPAAGRNELGHS